jgi:ubiquinone/menaquinone biosynthesis C-methylase UbiE
VTDSSPDEVTLVNELLRLVNGSWIAQACYVVARLGIPDLLASGPRSAADLAASTNTNAAALHRLLNGLGSVGICRLRDDGTFEMTPLGELLRKDVPSSMRAWTLHWGGESWPVWANLLHSVRTGQSARALITGTPGFSHLDRDPQAAAIFNQAMADLTRLTAIDVARVYDFSQKRIVDVGGGYGELLAQILIAHPTARGVLFDMAHAIDKARDSLAARGFSDRCEFAYGDFFESVPGSADVYVLKSVIHDWPDERARVILQTCRRAMQPRARLLVIERLMPEKLEPSPEAEALARSDLHMLVALGAQERTHAEMHALLASSGLKPLRTLDTASGFQIVESAA